VNPNIKSKDGGISEISESIKDRYTIRIVVSQVI
jgi:hypothetical protein